MPSVKMKDCIFYWHQDYKNNLVNKTVFQFQDFLGLWEIKITDYLVWLCAIYTEVYLAECLLCEHVNLRYLSDYFVWNTHNDFSFIGVVSKAQWGPTDDVLCLTQKLLRFSAV